MILRGPVFALTPVRVAVEELHAPAVARPAVAPAPAAAPVEARPAITLDVVSRWLDEQDADTRGALAGALATEIDDERAVAREQGWAEGCAEARAHAEEELASRVAALERVGAEIRAAFERDAAALAESCGAIVLEALRKIAGPIMTAPDAVAGAVAEVLQRVKDGHEVVVRVPPDDLDVLRAAEAALEQTAGAAVTLVADERVGLGGCIVESKLGNLDGRLEVQLAELCETLRGAKTERRKP